jgi:hypothetical protein
MSATAGVITYQGKTPARAGSWAILALVIAAALVGWLLIGRASAPTLAQQVRTIERFVPVTQPGTLPNEAQELASLKAAYGRALAASGIPVFARGTSVHETSAVPSPGSLAALRSQQLAP